MQAIRCTSLAKHLSNVRNIKRDACIPNLAGNEPLSRDLVSTVCKPGVICRGEAAMKLYEHQINAAVLISEVNIKLYNVYSEMHEWPLKKKCHERCPALAGTTKR